MWIRRDYDSPSMPLEQAVGAGLGGGSRGRRASLDKQLRERRERVEQVESIVPLAMVIPKGKATEVPTGRSHKKRKKTKPLSRRDPRRQNYCPPLCLLRRQIRYTHSLFLDRIGCFNLKL